MDQDATRRDLLLASVMAAVLPLGLSLGSSVASASPINPAETIIKLPADLAWTPTIRRAARIRARSRARPPNRAFTTRWCAGGRAI